jgi:hypothetical protein
LSRAVEKVDNNRDATDQDEAYYRLATQYKLLEIDDVKAFEIEWTFISGV